MVTDMDTALVPFAKQRGIGIINASPLHMGVLTDRGAPAWHPAPPEIHDAGRRVVALCREHGVDASALSLRFCLDHPYVASTLVRMASRGHVEKNLKCLGLQSNPELLREIREVVAHVLNCVWPSGRTDNYG